jgi:hypothetical protein
MAVPSSGTLSLARIRGELQSNNYSLYTSAATSLGSSSNGTYGTINTYNSAANRPDGNQPHKMSEFYAYDHDYNPVDFSATLTTGVTTYYGNTFSGYRTGFPGPIGSMSNTSFNNYTIGNLSYFGGTNPYIELTFTSGRIGFSNLTIGGTSYGGSSSWTAVGSNLWKYSTSTNPFGSSGTIVSITAQY